MQPIDAGVAAPAPSDTANGAAAADPSLGELAHSGLAFARAWGRLVAGEATLAKANLGRILIAAVVLVALVFGTLFAIEGLLFVLLLDLIGHATLAVLATVLLDAVALYLTLRLLRGWWRTLSLPQSRAALTRLWRSHDVGSSISEEPHARGAG